MKKKNLVLIILVWLSVQFYFCISVNEINLQIYIAEQKFN